MCKRNDIQECDIALASFDSAYVIAMEVCQFRKLLLREALLESEPAQVDSKRNSRVGSWHAAMIGLMTTMSLHTMSVICWNGRSAKESTARRTQQKPRS